MEILFNFDENSNFVKRSTFTQDFREVHSKCWVMFPFPEQLDFVEGFGFVYRGQEWEAVSYKRVVSGGSSYLSVLGYPRSICTYIDKKHENLESLAKAVGAVLAPGSVNLKFEFPLRDILFGPLLYKYRFESLEQNADHADQGWFIFYDSRGLFGCSYSELVGGETLKYSTGSNAFLGGSYSFIRDYLVVRYQRDHPPSKVNYKNWIGSLVGDKFDLQAVIPGIIGAKYELSGGDEALFSKYDKLILVRQKFDSAKQPLPWVLTFGQLCV